MHYIKEILIGIKNLFIFNKKKSNSSNTLESKELGFVAILIILALLATFICYFISFDQISIYKAICLSIFTTIIIILSICIFFIILEKVLKKIIKQ